MAENNRQVPPGDPSEPPRAPRPRPQYGELAPEGWSWNPQQDEQGPAAEVHSRAQQPVSPLAARPQPAISTGRAGGAPGWDRPLTLGLLVLGLLATFFAVSVLNALPQAVQMLYTQEDLGTYTPGASVTGLIIGGSILEGVLWLATAAVSVLLLVRGRRAFYVPLIGGVVGVVVIFVFLSIALATDPTLLDFYGRP